MEVEEEEGIAPIEEVDAVSSRPAPLPILVPAMLGEVASPLLFLSAIFSCMRASAMAAAGLPGSVAICIDATCNS